VSYKIFHPNEDYVEQAAEAVLEDGVIGVEGTKSTAEPFAYAIIECAKNQYGIDSNIDYMNCEKHGYLYFVVDFDRHPMRNREHTYKSIDLNGVEMNAAGQISNLC